MAAYELIMPKLGESIVEATILKWTKDIGEEIDLDDTILEIATDKVDSEVPSPVEGKLVEKRFEEGDVVPVGEVVAIIGTGEEIVKDVPHVPASDKLQEHEKAHEIASGIPFVPKAASIVSSSEDTHERFYSPLVLNIARKEGIPMKELDELSGSGRGGRVTKKDILEYVKVRIEEEPSEVPVAPQHTNHDNGTEKRSSDAIAKDTLINPPLKQAASRNKDSALVKTPVDKKEKLFSHKGAIEIMPMDRMRKVIAENMIYSQQTSAHVTSFVEADVTHLVQWRERVKHSFYNQYGEKLTYTPIFVQAIVKALRTFPNVNSSIEGENILIKKDIHVGIAVALPTDNLIVPVIKHADRLNLAGLTAAVNDLASRARNNKLTLDELEGGTYTLSNVGTFGNVMGTPIIMQPQVAIMAVGAIRKVPAVLETPSGDVIAIRQKMYLSHSYDHRIIDGALGGKFVRKVADILEDWDPETTI